MRINKDPKLSKSRFLSGRQCHLRLWYSCFNRDLASVVSPAQQAIFDTGHEVGELATRLYPEGILIREDYLHHEEAVQTTLKAMQDPNVRSIYEAAFFYDGNNLDLENFFSYFDVTEQSLSLQNEISLRIADFIYTTYEKGIIKRLAEHFPQFRNDLLLIPKRFKDLCAIIRNNFYHPGFHGSFSLKSVLPTLVPDMDYEKLAIQEGNQASFEFLRMIAPSNTPEEKQRIKQELLEYCGYDTLAMVKIRDKLDVYDDATRWQ